MLNIKGSNSDISFMDTL